MSAPGIAGRAALVTGASSGLGRHFALTLARAGAKVAIAARRADRLGALAAEIAAFDGRAVPIVMDVTSATSVEAGIAAAETELGPLAILVNNAGVAAPAGVLDITEADWDRVVDTDLKGVFLVAQATARHMARHGHGGSIINIASILAGIVAPGIASYCAAKGGVAQLTRALALELARHRIRVNALCPGFVETDMNREFLTSPAGQAVAQRIPQRRIGRPEDLDGALLLLASDASAYMTGSLITVDGGHSLTGV
jgi:NAD(P)-dependent dehydrogenase (short-subunit alcohol dehydrogenase family)